jgi:hypothetical protein
MHIPNEHDEVWALISERRLDFGQPAGIIAAVNQGDRVHSESPLLPNEATTDVPLPS